MKAFRKGSFEERERCLQRFFFNIIGLMSTSKQCLGVPSESYPILNLAAFGVRDTRVDKRTGSLGKGLDMPICLLQTSSVFFSF